MQRDRNIPDLEGTDVEQDDITVWINIIAKHLEVCFISFVTILSLFSILFIYYNFDTAFAIVKWSFYLWGIYFIIEYIKIKYIKINWKNYIRSIENYAVFAPFGKPTLDSGSEYDSDCESDCENDCENDCESDCDNGCESDCDNDKLD